MACCECKVPDQAKFLGSILFTIIGFALCVYGGVTEVQSDLSFQRKLRTLNVAHISQEVTALKVYTIIYICSFGIILFTLTMLSVQNCRLAFKKLKGKETTKKQQRIAAALKAYQLILATATTYKTIIFGSLLNKFRADGLWNGSPDYSLESFFVVIPYFGTRDMENWTIEQHLKGSITIAIFNIFRTMVLFIPMVAVEHPSNVKKFGYQLLFIIPSTVVAAIVGFKGVSSTMVEHYTQRFFTEQQQFHPNHTVVTSVVGAVAGCTVMTCLLIRVTQILHNKLNIQEDAKLSRSQVTNYVNAGVMKTYSQLLGVREEDEDEKAEQAASVMASYTIWFSTNSNCFFYALIGFAITLSIHQQIGIWDWYFTIDVVYSGIIWIFTVFDCCCLCCSCGATMPADEEREHLNGVQAS